MVADRRSWRSHLLGFRLSLFSLSVSSPFRALLSPFVDGVKGGHQNLTFTSDIGFPSL